VAHAQTATNPKASPTAPRPTWRSISITPIYNPDGTVFQSPIFTSYVETQYYWKSTADASDPTESWTVYSRDFGVYDVAETNIGYTLAVR
jgi:hypothetical protein